MYKMQERRREKYNTLFNYEHLKKAFWYYGIDDVSFLAKCEECINTVSNINITEFENLFELLEKVQKDDDKFIATLWKYNNIESIIGCSVPNIFHNLFLLIYGYLNHEKNMEKYSFSKRQKEIHKNRVKEIILYDAQNGITMHKMIWGIYFINCRLIEIGILQFDRHSKNEVRIHIPTMKKLDVNKV